MYKSKIVDNREIERKLPAISRGGNQMVNPLLANKAAVEAHILEASTNNSLSEESDPYNDTIITKVLERALLQEIFRFACHIF